jgi:hypothetical protein
MPVSANWRESIAISETLATAALLHNGGVQPFAKFRRKLVDLMFAVDRNRFAGCIENDFAVVALTDVGLYFGEKFRVNMAVEIVGQL